MDPDIGVDDPPEETAGQYSLVLLAPRRSDASALRRGLRRAVKSKRITEGEAARGKLAVDGSDDGDVGEGVSADAEVVVGAGQGEAGGGRRGTKWAATREQANGPEEANRLKEGNGPSEADGFEDGNGPKEGNGPTEADGPKGGNGPKEGNGPREADGFKEANGPEEANGPKEANGSKEADESKQGNALKEAKRTKEADGPEEPDAVKGADKLEEAGKLKEADALKRTDDPGDARQRDKPEHPRDDAKADEREPTQTETPTAIVMRTGVGPRRARRAVRDDHILTAKAIAVAGIGRALADRVQPGDVVVADQVRTDALTEGVVPPTRLVPSAPRIAALLRQRGLTVHVGSVISTDNRVNDTVRDRLAMTRALIADRESAWLLAACGKIPIACVRVAAHRRMRGWRRTARTLRIVSATLTEWAAAAS